MSIKGRIILCFMAFITVVISAVSCDDSRIYHKYQAVSTFGWYRDDTLTFDIPRQWEGRYLLDVGVRTTKNFPYQGVSLVVDCHQFSSKGKKKVMYHSRNIVRCKIMDKKGQIQGDKNVSNNVTRSQVMPLFLQRCDSMHITIHHRMHKDALPGIYNVGIKLIKGKR